MPDKPEPRLHLNDRVTPVGRARVSSLDVGHYFEQGFFERQQILLAARAEALAMADELVRLGVEIDPITGEVRLRSA